MSEPLIIHIGLHKTATTFLQEEVFSQEALGFAQPEGDLQLAATDEFVNTEPVAFRGELAAKRFEPFLAGAREHGLVPVISDERLSSIPEMGRYHLPETLRRLKETFGEFRILLTIREQRSLALALYRQSVRSGSLYGLSDFLGTGDEVSGWTSPWNPDFFDYERLMQACIAATGGEHGACVLPLEMLRSDPREFYRRLFSFCGVRGGDVNGPRHNTGFGPLTTEIVRTTNRLAVRNPLGPDQPFLVRTQAHLAGWFDRLLPESINRIPNKGWQRLIHERIGRRYADSNARLSAAIRVDLAALGYACTNAPGDNGAAEPDKTLD